MPSSFHNFWKWFISVWASAMQFFVSVDFKSRGKLTKTPPVIFSELSEVVHFHLLLHLHPHHYCYSQHLQ